jgi:hypothetical protein
MAKSRSGSLLLPFSGERGKGSYGASSWIRSREESTVPGPGRNTNAAAQFIGQLQIKKGQPEMRQA